MLHYTLPSAVEAGYVDVDQGSKAEGGADEHVALRQRREALGAAESATENAATQMYVIAAAAEDETLEVQRAELGSGQKRMGLAVVGAGGVVGDLRNVKRDRLARTTTWPSHY